jgi:hypothetical protein
MYREMTTQVNWDNHLSEKIYINQGIQQGEKLSTSLYKCYNNAILDSVTESGLGSHLGTISVAAPTCADDILILIFFQTDGYLILLGWSFLIPLWYNLLKRIS